MAVAVTGSLITLAGCTNTEADLPVTSEQLASVDDDTTSTDAERDTTPAGDPNPTNGSSDVPSATGSDLDDDRLDTNFVDEFDGDTLDDRWTVVERFGDISNAEAGCYLDDNVSVADGQLMIKTSVDPDGCRSIEVDAEYSSGMVQWRTFNYAYGTLEVRARVGGGRGPWPAIWLLGSDCQPNNPSDANHPDCTWPEPGSDEIDVVEFFNGDFETLNNQVHAVDGSPQCITGVADASVDWHVYSLDWAPDSLVFGVDGETTCVIDEPVLATEKFLIINTAVGGAGGEIDDDTFPVTMAVDYVRVTTGPS